MGFQSGVREAVVEAVVVPVQVCNTCGLPVTPVRAGCYEALESVAASRGFGTLRF
jgi:hypothetical protein